MLSILFLVSFTIVIVISLSSAFGDEYLAPIGKLSHAPTICAVDPQQDPRFPTLTSKMITETRNAVLDWELKLSNDNSAKNPWHMPVNEIPASMTDSFDKANCDIIINYYAEPENPEDKLHEAGVEWTGNDDKSYINIYYLGVDVNIIEKEYGGFWYYVQNFTYANHFATDPQLKSTIRHELGHSLGLNHYYINDDSELTRTRKIQQGIIEFPSIMIPIVINTGATHFDITPADVSEVKSIYGNNGFPSIPKQLPVQNTVVIPTMNNTQQPQPTSTQPISAPSTIPPWIKNTVRMWSKSEISDNEFFNVMGYLTKQGILKVSTTNSNSNSPQNVPAWVRSNADLWTSSQITDYEFLRGIEYLISNGIIRL